jgi:hypothetical protein
MPIAKPSSHIDWVPSEAGTSEPSAGKKSSGYVAGEAPPAAEHNWIFARVGNWQKYFESATDELLTASLQFDAVVGSAPGATHTTLQAAHDAVSAGSSILVLDGESLTTRVSISKADIEIICKPGVVYDKSADTVGIEISGSGCRISGARFTSYTAGGDIAVRFVAGGDYGTVEKYRFALSTDTEVDDSGVTAGKKPNVVNNHSEV